MTGSEGFNSGKGVHTLDFHPKHARPLLEGLKTCTARPTWALDFDPEPGMGLNLLDDEQDEFFAAAGIMAVYETTIASFIALDPAGHRSYDSAEEMIDELQQYYPGTAFNRTTKLWVIYIENITENNQYEL